MVGSTTIDVLPAEQAAFAGMRIERRDCDPAARNLKRLERLVGERSRHGLSVPASHASARLRARYGW